MISCIVYDGPNPVGRFLDKIQRFFIDLIEDNIEVTVLPDHEEGLQQIEESIQLYRQSRLTNTQQRIKRMMK